LLESGATCIAYETVQTPDGRLHLLTPMSEIAGRLAPQIGAYFLERMSGGKGKLLGGATGVKAANVVILGAGIAAWLALPAKEALGNSLRMGLGIWTLPAALALVVWFPQLRVEKQAVPTTRDGDKSSVWRNPIAWQVTVFLGTSSLIFFGVFSWLPQIDTSRGISTSTSGYLLLLAIVFGIVGSLGAPTLARRFGDQRPAVVVASLIQMVGFLGLFLAPAQTAIFCAAVFGVGNGGTLSLALLLIVLRSADEHVAARLSSMAQAAGYLIAATGPLVTGLLHELLGGWSASIWFLMLAGLACLLAGFSAGYDRVVGGVPVSAAS